MSYVPKLQKQSNSYQFASIWRQNDQKCWVTSQIIQNNAKLQNWSNYNELHRFDVKTIKTTLNYKRNQITMNLHQFDIRTIKNVEARRKTFKTTQNYKSDLISINLHRFDVRTIKNRKTTKAIKFLSICIDLTSKRSKMSSYVVKHWKLRKTQNYKSNQIRINLHRFEVKTIKNVELRRKTFKTTQNYESHQITMNCIDLMSKTSNQRKTTKVILFRWICTDLTSERSKQRKTTKVIKL